MANGVEGRNRGRVFNDFAGPYDRHRPGYPDALVDRAWEVAGLAAGDRVLEVGCGTGQLTGSLLARGLRVTAVEPGDQLIARARDHLRGAGDVEFVNARLEEAPVRHAGYRAVFSASAIHWVDPDVGWRKIAGALEDGGTLALLSYFGLSDARSDGDQQALRHALAGIAHELGAEWPEYRDLESMLAGFARHRGNVSEAWAWLGSYDLGRGYAAELFQDARLLAIPSPLSHTAEALMALLGTMSFWSRLSPGQRKALNAEVHALHERLGRPIRSSTVACVMMARRAPSS